MMATKGGQLAVRQMGEDTHTSHRFIFADQIQEGEPLESAFRFSVMEYSWSTFPVLKQGTSSSVLRVFGG